MAWVQIFLAPVTFTVVISYCLVMNVGESWAKYLAVIFCIIGIVSGIILANHIKRKRGTLEFLSGEQPITRDEEQQEEMK
ncbi:MAG: hypothetical protein RLY16_1393 [Bacteroidota bacterium]